MKFLIDAQLPAHLARLAAGTGHDAMHTRELPAGNASTGREITRFASARAGTSATTAAWRARRAVSSAAAGLTPGEKLRVGRHLSPGVHAGSAPARDEIFARRPTDGRTMEIRDVQIAGMAIARRGQLATRNTRHFTDLGITLFDPWSS